MHTLTERSSRDKNSPNASTELECTQYEDKDSHPSSIFFQNKKGLKLNRAGSLPHELKVPFLIYRHDPCQVRTLHKAKHSKISRWCVKRRGGGGH